MKLLFGVIQKVRSLRRGGEIIEKQTITNRGGGRGHSMCVCWPFEKSAEIFKIKFYSYSPVFPFDYNGSITY